MQQNARLHLKGLPVSEVSVVGKSFETSMMAMNTRLDKNVNYNEFTVNSNKSEANIVVKHQTVWKLAVFANRTDLKLHLLQYLT